MNNTKIALSNPEYQNGFQIKNIVLKISKKRNNEYKIKPIYIQGILHPSKENK